MIEFLFYNLFVGMGKGTTEKRGGGNWRMKGHFSSRMDEHYLYPRIKNKGFTSN